MSLLRRLSELRASGERGVLFTVVEGDGIGNKELVLETGERLGSGVPAEATDQFDEIVRRGRNNLLSLDGDLKVFAEWYGPPPRVFMYGAVDTAEALSRAAKLIGWTAIVGDARAMFLTRERMPSADLLIQKWPEEATGQFDELVRRGRNKLLSLDGDVKVFAEWYGPPPRVFVYGAVDTAEALCRAAKLLGWTAIVGDARGMFITKERIPSADVLIQKWPEEALAEIVPDHQTAVVVLTHDDKFDEPALKAALESEAFYVGALGSRRTTERRRGRLIEAGVAEEKLDRIMGPCGLDIGADTQEETALAIMAEILAVRAGRGGGPLKDSKQRIHVEV